VPAIHRAAFRSAPARRRRSSRWDSPPVATHWTAAANASNSGGRLIHVEQVLDEAHFSALKVGMPAEQVLRRIGHPSEASYLPRQKHTLWSYRYFNPFCIWFQVSIDTNGHVAELGQNFDPLCERRRFSPGFPF
jgi:hypothetical protein